MTALGAACAWIVCPARNKSEARLKAINMVRTRRSKRASGWWDFFLAIPDRDRRGVGRERARAAGVVAVV